MLEIPLDVESILTEKITALRRIQESAERKVEDGEPIGEYLANQFLAQEADTESLSAAVLRLEELGDVWAVEMAKTREMVGLDELVGAGIDKWLTYLSEQDLDNIMAENE